MTQQSEQEANTPPLFLSINTKKESFKIDDISKPLLIFADTNKMYLR